VPGLASSLTLRGSGSIAVQPTMDTVNFERGVEVVKTTTRMLCHFDNPAEMVGDVSLDHFSLESPRMAQ
jgi:hypothetical protein